jgi:hypothetical protein
VLPLQALRLQVLRLRVRLLQVQVQPLRERVQLLQVRVQLLRVLLLAQQWECYRPPKALTWPRAKKQYRSGISCAFSSPLTKIKNQLSLCLTEIYSDEINKFFCDPFRCHTPNQEKPANKIDFRLMICVDGITLLRDNKYYTLEC